MELIPVEVELEPAGAVDPTEFMWGDGAEGTEGFPEEVRETELLTLDTGTLLLFILLETWSTEFTMGLESGKTETHIQMKLQKLLWVQDTPKFQTRWGQAMVMSFTKLSNITLTLSPYTLKTENKTVEKSDEHLQLGDEDLIIQSSLSPDIFNVLHKLHPYPQAPSPIL